MEPDERPDEVEATKQVEDIDTAAGTEAIVEASADAAVPVIFCAR
jgi:hypothetical protein